MEENHQNEPSGGVVPAIEQEELPELPRRVRPSILAGGWYPGNPETLRSSIQSYLDEAEVSPPPQQVMGLIAPHAGHRYSGETAAIAYKTLMGRRIRRVFLLAPSHRAYFEGAVVPEATAFETPLGEVPISTAVTRALASQPGFAMDDRAHAREHSIEIQLPFLQVALEPGYHLVPILIGDLDDDLADSRRIAESIRPFVGPEDVVIASSDFTHFGPNYGYTPFLTDVPQNLENLDMTAFRAIEALSAQQLVTYRRESGITVCGYRPIAILLSLLPPTAQATLLKYDTSGRMTNDWSNSVSYLSIALTGPGWEARPAPSPPPPPAQPSQPEPAGEPLQILTPEEQATAIRLARAVLESYVTEGVIPDPTALGVDTSGALGQPYGVFVTLHKEGELRGCIGNIWPVEPLAQAIVGRTVDAAHNDHRFRPVQESELEQIDLEISVLSVPRQVAGPRDIEIGRHGIVIQKWGRRAVYLPQVAPEQGWDVPETLTHLSRKAGLPSDAWQEGATFEVFEAQVFEERPHP